MNDPQAQEPRPSFLGKLALWLAISAVFSPLANEPAQTFASYVLWPMTVAMLFSAIFHGEAVAKLWASRPPRPTYGPLTRLAVFIAMWASLLTIASSGRPALAASMALLVVLTWTIDLRAEKLRREAA